MARDLANRTNENQELEMHLQALRGTAFAFLVVAVLLGRFAPEGWTWAGPVTADLAVVGLLAMIALFVKTRQARRRSED